MTGWDDLRYVLAIGRTGTLTQAAASLEVTRTTVGRRLQALESSLGVRLFDRTPDGWLPTPAGDDLLQTAERVEGELLAVAGRLVGRDTELRGGLRVSTLEFLLWEHMAVYAAFMKRYPEVELTLSASSDKASLTRREADVAVRLTDRPPEGLIGRRVGAVEFAAYASTALVNKVGPQADYSAYPWVGFAGEQEGRWFDTWLATHAPGARVSLRIDDGAVVRRQAVCAGLGAHFMPTFEADRLAGLQRLGPIHFTRQVWLLTLPQLRRTARVRAFLQHFADALRS